MSICSVGLHKSAHYDGWADAPAASVFIAVTVNAFLHCDTSTAQLSCKVRRKRRREGKDRMFKLKYLPPPYD